MKPYKLITVMFLCAAPLLRADVIFEEDFEVDSPTALNFWGYAKDNLTEAEGAWIEILPDADNNFGLGSGNRVLVLNDRSESSQVYISPKIQGAEEVMTFAFDFFEPIGFDGGPLQVIIGHEENSGRISYDAANFAMNNGRFYNLLPDKSARAYDEEMKHRIQFVVNNSAGTVEYGDKTTLPSQCLDVYVDGVIVEAGVPFRRDGGLNVGEPVTKIVLLTYSEGTTDQTFMIDNFAIQTGAHAP